MQTDEKDYDTFQDALREVGIHLFFTRRDCRRAIERWNRKGRPELLFSAHPRVPTLETRGLRSKDLEKKLTTLQTIVASAHTEVDGLHGQITLQVNHIRAIEADLIGAQVKEIAQIQDRKTLEKELATKRAENWKLRTEIEERNRREGQGWWKKVNQWGFFEKK